MQPNSILSTDVLIVGAGPSGLALASTLARAGIAFVLLERLAEGQHTSRAAVIHAHTLEVLEEIGVSDRLVAEGIRVGKFAIRDRDRPLVQLRFDQLPTNHPYLLMLPQDRTEAILGAGLEAAGGSVQRGWSVDAVEDLGEHVRVSATSATEGRRTYHARYVVGADGMNSIVRKTAGIGFSGSSYEDSFVLADVEMDWSHGSDEVKLFFSPQGLVVVAPLAEGVFRIVATVAEAPERPDLAFVQALIDARGPCTGAAQVNRVRWSSRFRLHHRVADAYRRGPLFLVGDAAHVHSPAGGQGMNTGLVDACVLGRVLSEVVAGRRDATFLDTYEDMRRPAALKVLKLAGRLTSMATMKQPIQRAIRNLVLSIVGRLSQARRQLEMGLSGLERREAAQLPAI